MSIRAINAVLNALATLTQAEFAVMVILANFADDAGGNCWPSQPKIAKMARTTTRSVIRILKALTSRGILLVLEQGTGTRSTRYQIALDALARPDTLSPLRRRRAKGRPDKRDTVDVTTEHGRPDTVSLSPDRVSPDPLDPSVDPSLNRTPAQTPVCARPEGQRQEQGQEPPFKVYAAIAAKAIEDSLRDYRNDNPMHVSEFFKQRCAQEGLPYDSEITRKAVDAAIVAYDKARERFAQNLSTAVRRKASA